MSYGLRDLLLAADEAPGIDLSDRTIKRGEASARRRLERWRHRAFMIIQCAVTAGAAWLLASLLLGHRCADFAAAAAILVLGVAYGQRLRRGVDVAIGVTVGVALGDIWLLFFGIGVWQIALVCAIAMSLATLGAGSASSTSSRAPRASGRSAPRRIPTTSI